MELKWEANQWRFFSMDFVAVVFLLTFEERKTFVLTRTLVDITYIFLFDKPRTFRSLKWIF